MESPGYQISFLVSNYITSACENILAGEIDRTAGSWILGIRRADTDHPYFLGDPEYLLTVDGFDPRTLETIDHSGPYYLQSGFDSGLKRAGIKVLSGSRSWCR